MSYDANPFDVTRAADLRVEEVERLWVDLAGPGGRDALMRPTSPQPVLILGGKGSGKTHLMRYHSYPLQALRYQEVGLAPLEGLRRDGYLGIYVILGGMNTERFTARGQPVERWTSLFEYYMELWLARELLTIISAATVDDPSFRTAESVICSAIADLMDVPPDPTPSTIGGVLAWLRAAQRDVDLDANHVVFDGRFTTRPKVTRGRLIFGIPTVLAANVAALSDVRFNYLLDEFETIEPYQQVWVNTLVRERTQPSTFRIGARTYGLKTRMTLAAGEENRQGSEYDRVELEHRIREGGQWDRFARRLIQRRLDVAGIDAEGLRALFATPDLGWRSPAVLKRIGSPAPGGGAHFARLRDRLTEGRRDGLAPGVGNDHAAETIVSLLRSDGYPLLEKLNIMLLFQAWFRSRDLMRAAEEIAGQCKEHVSGRQDGRYAQALQHYQSDLLAQLLREHARSATTYFGLGTFVAMSEGLPRSLMQLLKSTYTWALYNQNERRPVSLTEEDQRRGVLETADWFLEEMRKVGEHGPAIRIVIERIAGLFEINRYADKPVECSLMAFSVAEAELAARPRTILRMLEERSFLIRTSSLEIDRNSQERLAKFQLSPMLAPKWGLPVARRGVTRFGREAANVIFDEDRERDFEVLRVSWQAKMRAPRFGRQKGSASTHPERQDDLFGNAS